MLQLLPSLVGGGVERGTLEVNRALTASQAESYVISAGGPLVSSIEADGGKHIKLDIGRKSPLTLLKVSALQQIIADLKPDVVHARSRLPAWVAWRAMRKMAHRPAFVTTVHGLYSVSRYSAIMTRGDRVIAVSNTARDYILKNYPSCPADRVSVIHRGIDPAQWPYGYKPDAVWRSAWLDQTATAVDPDAPVLLLPGRVKRSKGIDAFINLLAKLKDSGKPARGLIVGRGATTGRTGRYLDTQSVKAGLDGWLLRYEHRDDVRELMASSQCVLSLSQKPESFGRTVLEALSLGRPVVGFDHGGVGEIMAELYPDGLVAPFESDALLKCVSRMLTAPPPVPREHPYHLDQMLNQTLEIYDELASAGR